MANAARYKSKNKDSIYSYAKESGSENKSKYINNEINVDNKDKQQHDKNLWMHGNTSNLDINKRDKEISVQVISSSIQSNTSGMTYDAINMFPGTRERFKKPNKRQVHAKCRIMKVLVVISVLLVLGIVAFFIANNMLMKGDSCNKLSTIDNGNISMTDGSKTVVRCNEGHGPQYSQTITCKQGKWSPVQPCPLMDCGPYPTVAGGAVDGTNTTFASTARLQCIPGFMLQAPTTFTCLANGNWSSDNEPACIPHPCGPYTLTDYVLVKEDFSHINMTILTQCEDGFAFASGSDSYILCENSTWINKPKCEVQGKLSLETENGSVLVSGRPFSISCRLTDSPLWKTLTLARAFTNTSAENPLITVTDTSGKINNKSDDTVQFDKSVERLVNGVLLTATFNPVHCSDNGMYMCVFIVENAQEIKGNKTTRRDFNVIDISSTVEGINAKTMLTQGDKMVVRCTGKLGMDQNGTKLANMSIKIKNKDDSTAEVIPSVRESAKIKDCQMDETINASILVRNIMDDAELQCIVESNNGVKDKKSVILNVSTTIVHISATSSHVYIGDSFNISAELNNIRGWDLLQFRKNCSGELVVVAEMKNNENTSSSSIDEHILLDINVTETSANIILYFNGSKCSDACVSGDEIVYEVRVLLIDTWEEDSVVIEFQVKPTTPLLTIEQDKFYIGQEAVIRCVGNVGIPGRQLIIKENSEILPPSRHLISDTKFDAETCQNVTTLRYTFTVNEQDYGSHFSCEASDQFNRIESNILTVTVADPLLYFTEESKVGEIGSSKTLQCIVTQVANLTTVVISRYISESKLCVVNISGLSISSDCSAPGFSVVGSFSDNDNMFTTTVTIKDVSCTSEELYGCRTNTAKTEMKFKVTRDFKTPFLSLPTSLVEDQMTEWEDVLKCTADVGYPLDDKVLKIQIKYRDSSSYKDYSTNSIAKAKKCQENTSIILRQQIFSESYNGSTFRCVILDNNNTVIANSSEKSITLIKNVCIDDSAGEYDPHPYNCRRYIRCVGSRLYDHECAPNSCALTDSDPICSAQCTNCY